jgi:hypothetical protein
MFSATLSCSILAVIFMSVPSTTVVEVEEGPNIVSWNGALSWVSLSADTVPLPNYVGHPIQREPCANACEVVSLNSSSPSAGAFAGATLLLVEVQPGGGKGGAAFAYQHESSLVHLPTAGFPAAPVWVSTGYETGKYFPLLTRAKWTAQFDILSSYPRSAAVVAEQQLAHPDCDLLPITYTCAWGKTDGSIDAFRTMPTLESFRAREVGAVLMASNCANGGAERRTAYVAALADAFPVVSFGRCLHNRDLPAHMVRPVYDDHGSAMSDKTEMFANFMFVLAFENSNTTDYISEKVYNALLAGAIPIYSGSANIDEWLPHPDAVIRTDDFASPAALAEHLHGLVANLDEAYERHVRAWRRVAPARSFVERFDDCLFYTAGCRFCTRARQLATEPAVATALAHERAAHPQRGALLRPGIRARLPLHLPSGRHRTTITLMGWVHFDALPTVPTPIAVADTTWFLGVQRGRAIVCLHAHCLAMRRTTLLHVDQWLNLGAILDLETGEIAALLVDGDLVPSESAEWEGAQVPEGPPATLELGSSYA